MAALGGCFVASSSRLDRMVIFGHSRAVGANWCMPGSGAHRRANKGCKVSLFHVQNKRMLQRLMVCPVQGQAEDDGSYTKSHRSVVCGAAFVIDTVLIGR